MPKIAIYAGRGSSHSWTWFAEFLEHLGEHDARFLDGGEFIDSLRSDVDIVVVSGGDGFAIADVLKGQGFSLLKEFVSRGGTYVGICAGAYLPLPSRIPPLSEFNLSQTRIRNIDCSVSRENPSPRFSIPYGNCSVYHPVRGPVELSSESLRTVAPLYGGPVFSEPEDDRTLLRYVGFVAETEFQVDKTRAETLMVGQPAGIQSSYGRGELLLLGPHLEHPGYPEANRMLCGLLGLRSGRQAARESSREVPRAIARSLADLKVATLGLEGRSFLVGMKLWDASRFLELIRAIEAHSSALSRQEEERLRADLDTVRGALLQTKVGIESDVDEATILLVGSARLCVDSYFRSMVGGR